MSDKTFYRSIEIDRTQDSAIDEEKRTVLLAFSSEQPCNRGSYIEILDHSEDSINLIRLTEGNAPLLVNHDKYHHVGTVEEAWFDSATKVCRCRVRFGRGAEASEVFNDVVDGIRRNVSFGYFAREIQSEKREYENGIPVKRFAWEPFEVTIASCPVDTRVGVGRDIQADEDSEAISDDINEEIVEDKRDLDMSDKVEMTDEQVRQIQEEAIRAENDRRDEIEAIASGVRHILTDVDEIAKGYRGTSAEFNAEVVKRMASLPTPAMVSPQSDENLGMSEKETDQYSLGKAVRALVSGDWSEAGLELEASRALGGNANEVVIPLEVFQRADAPATTSTASGGIPKTLGNFVPALFNKSVCANLDAQFHTGLVGNYVIPRVVSGNTSQWLAEGATASDASAMSIVPVTLTPHRLMCKQPFTMELEDSVGQARMEQMVYDWVTSAVAESLDKAALAGAATGNDPTGIINTTGVDSVTIGTAVTYSNIVALKTAVGGNNALLGSPSFVVNHNVAGTLETTLKSANVNGYILENGRMAGYPVAITNSLADDEAIFGNFKDLHIGLWGNGIRLQKDPYSYADSGLVVIRAVVMADVGLGRTDSFAISDDISI